MKFHYLLTHNKIVQLNVTWNFYIKCKYWLQIIFDEHSMWPLQTHLRNGSKTGLELNGYFDATNFIESPDEFHNQDNIIVEISSFETDSFISAAIGIPNFKLMPCEEIRISLALEYYSLEDRPESRCRDDYPEQIKSMFKAPMTAELFYNPAFAPNLPYDPFICNNMCFVSYILQRCHCYATYEAWRYVGLKADYPLCVQFGNNCSMLESYDTRWSEIQDCNCHKKCSGHRFRIVSNEKMRYSYGNKTTSI